ncbi:isocitrate lyase/phosphoenolpyruvate mutase family protein [Candidatus Pelagibacter sp.]|nr:isocitrate lyase/phosphoenolpyruvate mutase family protein [Candidatus Pelagibacter sp.]
MHFVDKEPSQKRADFVSKLKSNKILRVPGAYNPLTAKLIEEIGYDAVYVSGGVMANDLGFPDIGLTTLQDVSTRSYLISRVTSLPTIVDIDTGFKSCEETIKTFEEFGIIAGSVERVAIEIRHLQRTEVYEVQEYFSKDQKGSSAMPHKKNPILSENLTGLARIVRSAVIPALENIALWHERDISHSSVERKIGPDANITLDFALTRLSNILDKMIVYPKKMIKNLNITKGLIFSQEVMLELTKSGLSREQSYKMVQNYAKKCFAENLNLFDVISNDKFIMAKISSKKLKAIFNYSSHFKNVDLIFRRVFK